MKNILSDGRHALAFVCVMTIFLSTCGLWWFVLVGGNPYHAHELRIYNRDGVETYQFRRGDWVYVRRNVCIDRDILAELSPALYDINRRALFPLPSSAVVAASGCAWRSGIFQVPADLPPGPYEYRNVARFQNNLVGRDEANSYPPTRIEVLP